MSETARTLDAPQAMTPERQEFLASIVVTAIEGGIGYWSQVDTYRWWFEDLSPNGAGRPDNGMAFAYATIEDTEDNQRRHSITHQTIENGIAAFVNGQVRVREDILANILVGNATNDGGMIDAEAADCIVQAGLFGAVIYG